MVKVLLLFPCLILIPIILATCEIKEYDSDRMNREIKEMEHKVKMKDLQDELDGKYDFTIQEIHCIESDYEIDLKPNYIIVYSPGGNVDTIPYGTLEAFFERDNM